MLLKHQIRAIRNLAIFLTLMTSFSLSLEAQLRPRTESDANFAKKNGYWYDNTKYEFQQQYPKLEVIPPLSTDMPYDILLSYVYLDSLMRWQTNNLWERNRKIFQFPEWISSGKKNDTIVAMVKYLYKMKDYDPIRFYQYMQNLDGNFYVTNLNTIDGSISELVKNMMLNKPNESAIIDLNRADYILHIKVNDIQSMPWKNHDNAFVYNVCATVIDTLKGKRFNQCNNFAQPTKHSKNKILNNESNICFRYITGPYSNGNNIIDKSLLDANGNLSLHTGQELVVLLAHYEYLWDYNYDYFKLTLFATLPIIDGKVIDNDNEWNEQKNLPYQDWKNAFMSKVNILLNGAY